MLIKAPQTIENIMLEDVLVPMPDDDIERRKNKQVPIKQSDYPIVSIGQPTVYPISEIGESKKPLIDTSSIMKENRFYLVQFVCSFRPHEKAEIAWARFSVRLIPDSNKSQAIAHDLYPVLIEKAIKNTSLVKLSPSFKFDITGVKGELKAGELGYTIEYTQLQPRIVAHGQGETLPTWEYRQVQGKSIIGSKVMYLIMRVPKSAISVRALLGLEAELVSGKNRFLAWINPDSEMTSNRLFIKLV